MSRKVRPKVREGWKHVDSIEDGRSYTLRKNKYAATRDGLRKHEFDIRCDKESLELVQNSWRKHWRISSFASLEVYDNRIGIRRWRQFKESSGVLRGLFIKTEFSKANALGAC